MRVSGGRREPYPEIPIALSRSPAQARASIAKTPGQMFGRYLDLSGQAISRAQAQERMFAKLANPRFLLDMRPLLRADQLEALTEESTAESFRRVFTTPVDRLPGEEWGRTPAMKERFGIAW